MHIKQVHLKIKDFKCPSCNYCCYTGGALRRHVAICTGEFTGSSGEYAIIQILDRMGADYLYDTTYWGVKDKGLLRWDFIINPTSETPAIIEYDGKFHYHPIRMGNMTDEEAEYNLKTTQRRDKIKNDYCFDNNIFMLRIPYTEKGNIEDIVPVYVESVTSVI
jgi:hypothetical protein